MARVRLDNKRLSARPWGAVNKAALARRLDQAGDAAAIREAFAYVPDLHVRSSWGGPHHELTGGDRPVLIVNIAGVHALRSALEGARGGTKWGAEAEAAADDHCARHEREIERQGREEAGG